jgi:FAD/FMN-containing dehydrogenase
MNALSSWGGYPRHSQTAHGLNWPEDAATLLARMDAEGHTPTLAFGMGRSYGDSCLAASDHVLVTRGMDRLIAADWENGIVLAQAGMTLAALIDVALPRGWFPTVTPGTKFVTLGGAVANDVHGKSHHVSGTFGRHVRKMRLLRSDEGQVECSPDLRPELFAATVGGLGLTGIILAVELQLRRVTSSEIVQRSIRFGNLEEFFALSAEYDHAHEYTAAWVDCLADGRQAGRGHYWAGDHAEGGSLRPEAPGRLSMPFDPPVSLVNALSLCAFNTLYYHRQWRKIVDKRISHGPFFYPLDGVGYWNRLYGKQGFQQFQCVIPKANGREAITAIMAEIARGGTGSFLAVLKQCGDAVSPGLLSFPLPGVSLALDFPQREANTALFARLDSLVHEAGGRLYPAKDAHMRAEDFQRAYPAWTEVERLRDPKLLSRFWKRVTQ